MSSFLSLHKKWSFPLRIYSINVTNSAECCEFGYIYWINSVENLIDTTAFQTYMKARRKYRRSNRLHLTIFIVSLNLTVTLTMSVIAPQALVLVRVIVCAAKHTHKVLLYNFLFLFGFSFFLFLFFYWLRYSNVFLRYISIKENLRNLMCYFAG